MEYLDRIMASVRYIERHLDQKLKIDDIAKHAGYSSFHFQRLFHQITFQTIGQYIHARKMTEAAKMLRESRLRIVDVSYQFGFESHEAFTRAFKARFGVLPNQWKRSAVIPPNLIMPALKEDYLAHIGQLEPEAIEQVEMEAMMVRGYHAEDSTIENIHRSWEQLSNSCLNRDVPKYGIVQYPECMDGEVAYSYLAATDIEQLKALEGQQRFHIPGGKYQVFWHRGEVEKLPLTYRYIYGTWFTRNPVPLVGGFDFEYYDGSFQAVNDAEAMVKIYVPIA
ncbi:helix-turn-helix domain-containing protein [Paenibacillus pinihumi]|uniref:helix-turn-helix domain-containing protein n=1 Tax=Paenibacillus pinihumi TaxID=669462 RepID=UPI00048AB01D|nr:helix-turn-helix domain-containing protein [Paenibacillus pinihumi]